MAGDVVWVTNGVYATGGRSAGGPFSNLTNRVVLDKALTVRSVNGPYVTVIQGRRDPATTNGLLAERCAWLTNGASLIGFTLQGGATRAGTGGPGADGGAAWCISSNSFIENCIIKSNTAGGIGAVFQGTLRNCFITENKSANTYNAVVHGATLNHCTVANNLSVGVIREN